MTTDVYGSSSRTAVASNTTTKHEQTHVVELFVAGDIEHGKQIIRKFCFDHPCCVTVTSSTYIYRGGEENGFVVGFRNYPRFSEKGRSLREMACELGDLLRSELGQDSYMVVDHCGQTTWDTRRQGG